MRTAAALMTVILVTVVVLCPSVICAVHAASQPDSCCHKSHQSPCPAKTAPDCPYTLLEKSRTNTGLSPWTWAVAAVWTPPAVPALAAGRVSQPQTRLVDSGGSFLRNCVLLV
ncbi:MAG TPA: hypothetical protein VMI94_27880 [Bryobacteraceae bacterium]|nr:hypothetical protein [Bryobacteraceae bacterium]